VRVVVVGAAGTSERACCGRWRLYPPSTGCSASPAVRPSFGSTRPSGQVPTSPLQTSSRSSAARTRWSTSHGRFSPRTTGGSCAGSTWTAAGGSSAPSATPAFRRSSTLLTRRSLARPQGPASGRELADGRRPDELLHASQSPGRAAARRLRAGGARPACRPTPPRADLQARSRHRHSQAVRRSIRPEPADPSGSRARRSRPAAAPVSGCPFPGRGGGLPAGRGRNGPRAVQHRCRADPRPTDSRASSAPGSYPGAKERRAC
jgi:hypothetical protein